MTRAEKREGKWNPRWDDRGHGAPAPRPVRPTPLGLLLWHGLACDVPAAVRAEEWCAGLKEQSDGVRVGGGGGEAWMGRQHGRWPVNCSGVATTRYICSIVLERIHPRCPHSFHDFSKRAGPENVADIVLLFLVR